MRARPRTRALLLALALAAPDGLRAQQPPRFEAEVELVAFDVSVVDANGAPVRDLGPADFTLKVGGTPRRVVSAEFVAQSGGDEPAPAPPVPAHFSSNEGLVAGRLVLIVVDQGNIEAGGGREMIQAAGRLLDRLGPADRVGLISLPGPEPREEFTTDRERVRAALQRVVGRGRLRTRQVSLSEALALAEGDDPDRWRRAVARECPGARPACVSLLESEARTFAFEYRDQSEQSLRMLGATFRALEPIEARKVFVLISQGLGLPDSGSLARPTPRLREVTEAAARARAALYVVRVRRGPGAGADRDTSIDLEDDRFLHDQGLESLAGLAHGTVLRGGPEASFDRLAREISGYYLLGFEPGEGERDGKPRDVEVKVARPGLTVRARATMVMRPATGAKAEEEALVASLRSPIAATSIPVRVTAYALRDEQADKVRLIVSGEIGREPIPGLVVAAVLVDERGKVVASNLQRSRPEAAMTEGPSPFVATLRVPPARYVLKVAVRDRIGRQGSVERPVNAAVTTAGGLEFSDLLLGLPPAPGSGVRPGLGLALREGMMVAHLELYGEGAAEVRMDVCRAVDSPSLLEVPASLAATPTAGRRVAQAVVPVEGLAPGDYVVRATVSVAGAPVGAASHPFRVTP